MEWIRQAVYGRTDEPLEPHQEQAANVRRTLQIELGKVNAKIMRLERSVEKATSETRRLVQSGQKKAALSSLRKRKQHETELKQARGVQLNLEVQLQQLRSIQDTKGQVEGLKQANECSKELLKQVSVEEVDRVLEDQTEIGEDFENISEALSSTTHLAGRGLDDFSMMEELAAFEAELAIEDAVPPQTPPVQLTELPRPPQHVPSRVQPIGKPGRQTDINST